MLRSFVDRVMAAREVARLGLLAAGAVALLAAVTACGSGISEEQLDASVSDLRQDVQALEGQIAALAASISDSDGAEDQRLGQLEAGLSGQREGIAGIDARLATQQQGFADIEARLVSELEALGEAGNQRSTQSEALARAIAKQQDEFDKLDEQLQAALAGSGGDPEPDEPKPIVSTADYEVWAMDQFNNEIYVINPQLEVVETFNLSGAGLERTHWINFTSDYKYGWIANTVSGNVAVVRAEDRTVVETFDTGPSSHAADIYPDDSGVLVSVIGTGELVEIVADHRTETFAIGRRLKIAEDPMVLARAAEFGSTNPLEPPKAKPVTSAFTRDGRYAYVTLGPALKDGGLVIVDMESFTVVKAYPPNEVAVNLMGVLSADGRKMYVTGGSKETTSFVYVFDTDTHELIAKDSTRGADAHGVALTPDGTEVWVTNRWTGNVAIMSTSHDELLERIPFVGVAPDLIAISPDGVYAFILLRGAQPEATGAMAGFGETPAVVVVSVETRETVDILIAGKPSDTGDPPDLDYHGIAIRRLN